MEGEVVMEDGGGDGRMEVVMEGEVVMGGWRW